MRKQNRSKTLKLLVTGNEVHELVLKPILDTNIKTVSYNGKGIPKIEDIRKSLEPAYEALAIFLNPFISNTPIHSKDLINLSAELLPVEGYYIVKVSLKIGDVIQPYKVFIKPKDGLTLAMRYHATPLFDASKDRMQEMATAFDIL